MKKPPPPDDSRIEIIIADSESETQQTAIETARILSAGKLIPQIERNIRECRERISAVASILRQCSYFMGNLESYFFYHSVHLWPANPNMEEEYIRRTLLNSPYKNGLLDISPPQQVLRCAEIINQLTKYFRIAEFNCNPRGSDEKRTTYNEAKRISIQCHEEIIEIFSEYLLELQVTLETHEAELAELKALVFR